MLSSVFRHASLVELAKLVRGAIPTRFFERDVLRAVEKYGGAKLSAALSIYEVVLEMPWTGR